MWSKRFFGRTELSEFEYWQLIKQLQRAAEEYRKEGDISSLTVTVNKIKAIKRKLKQRN